VIEAKNDNEGGESSPTPSKWKNEMENDKKSTTGKRPTHAAWWVKEREGKTDDWRQIGVAWNHADGKGISVDVDCVPLNGRIVLRLIEPKPKRERQA
jgi:hypothetical protein